MVRADFIPIVHSVFFSWRSHELHSPDDDLRPAFNVRIPAFCSSPLIHSTSWYSYDSITTRVARPSSRHPTSKCNRRPRQRSVGQIIASSVVVVVVVVVVSARREHSAAVAAMVDRCLGPFYQINQYDTFAECKDPPNGRSAVSLDLWCTDNQQWGTLRYSTTSMVTLSIVLMFFDSTGGG